MDNSLELNIGKRIKSLRKGHGLSMRDLAARSSLSANAISLIERGENSPTVSSLKRLSKALGVPINEFFREDHETPIVHLKSGQGMRIQNSKYKIESLGYGLPNQQIEPYCITIDPDIDMSSNLISHTGQEFVYCLSGEIEYYVGNKQIQLNKGDSLLFDALSPHGWCNLNKEQVMLLIIFQTFQDSHLARQRHIKMSME